MTQKEILEYNKKCALFLGWDQYLDVNERFYGNWKPNTTLEKPWSIRVERLFFHSDWNWIMEVVEAIGKIEIKEVQEKKPNIELNRQLGRVLDLPIYTKKEAVVKAINQFLIWYNSERL